MAIELIDKIAPKNDGFVGMVDADQVIGGAEGGTLPNATVSSANIIQHIAEISEKSESFTLDATDISNKYIDIAGTINNSQSVYVIIENVGIMAEQGIDFSYSGSNVYWTGYELENTLEVGDKLRVFYT